MTGPLLDRDAIHEVIHRARALAKADGKDDCRTITSGVLDYLRSVLTPEALRPHPSYVLDGERTHRRIFGEDG